MSTPGGKLMPKTRSTKEYLRQAAARALTNTALAYTCIILASGLIGLSVYTIHWARSYVAEKPVVVRVEKVGRAEAVNMEWDEYTPEDSDMKYFLTQFTEGFLSRDQHTVQDVYNASLHFLRPDLLKIVNRSDRETKWMAKFVTSNDPDIDVNVINVGLDRSMEASGQYKAVIDAVRTIRSPGVLDTKSIPVVITCWFESHPEWVGKDKTLIKYNPLGFFIYSYRVDEAFGQSK